MLDQGLDLEAQGLGLEAHGLSLGFGFALSS